MTQAPLSREEIRLGIEGIEADPSIKGFVLYEGPDPALWRGPCPEQSCRACHLIVLREILAEMEAEGDDASQLDWLRNMMTADEWIEQATEEGIFDPSEMALSCSGCGEEIMAIDRDYEKRCHQAALSQGALAISDALRAQGIPNVICQTGGFCMVVEIRSGERCISATSQIVVFTEQDEAEEEILAETFKFWGNDDEPRPEALSAIVCAVIEALPRLDGSPTVLQELWGCLGSEAPDLSRDHPRGRWIYAEVPRGWDRSLSIDLERSSSAVVRNGGRMTERQETQRQRRGHQFYPPESQMAEIPALYATEALRMPDKIIRLHYFLGSCDWWIAEIDRDNEESLAFGFVNLGDPQNAEWGYISLRELEEMTVFGFVVERDLHWDPKPFSEIQR